jgi:hypothetical protein
VSQLDPSGIFSVLPPLLRSSVWARFLRLLRYLADGQPDRGAASRGDTACVYTSSSRVVEWPMV